MTFDQIWAERVQGKTLADLAKEKGVDTLDLVDALVASQKTMLDQAVTDNRLTQAQADKWLEWYKQSAALQLTEPYGLGFGFGGMRGGRGGPGGMQGPAGTEWRTPPQVPTAPSRAASRGRARLVTSARLILSMQPRSKLSGAVLALSPDSLISATFAQAPQSNTLESMY
jgi:hypothetical protein